MRGLQSGEKGNNEMARVYVHLQPIPISWNDILLCHLPWKSWEADPSPFLFSCSHLGPLLSLRQLAHSGLEKVHGKRLIGCQKSCSHDSETVLRTYYKSCVDICRALICRPFTIFTNLWIQFLFLLGSSSSAFGGANFGAKLSVLGVSDLGSSLPMRSGSEEKYGFSISSKVCLIYCSTNDYYSL